MKRFLKYARIDSFGAFSNKTVGPFAPGMNVVFGKNEAGKTTLSRLAFWLGRCPYESKHLQARLRRTCRRAGVRCAPGRGI